MKNIPRIFMPQDLESGKIIAIEREISHYLSHVMRRNDCLVFNNGDEYTANISPDGKNLIINEKTVHKDPSNNIIVYFSPIKRLDDMLNMVTQLGVAKFVPVITERTVAQHINWARMKKIVIEASEQSNRNTVPEIAEPIKFQDLDVRDMFFCDERAAYGYDVQNPNNNIKKILIGPEGGFSEKEFDILDKKGAIGVSLGKTILRAEVAAVVAVSRIL
ncbi:MAG: RsmE family RNA methyltransferase [Alphaproteobacteria bacterium]